MKANTWMGAGLLAIPLHLAWANGERPPGEPAAPANDPPPPALAADVEAPADQRSAPQPGPRLRDSLRQSADGGNEPFQPYRLSLEERQRMREQLRHHGTIEFRVKP